MNKKIDKLEICFSGSGGQGVILAGVILAEAAAIYEEKNAIQTQSYGPESRGGASRSEVIISDGELFYPKVMGLDILVAMTQEACDKYNNLLRPNGILIVDSLFVKTYPKNVKNLLKVPFTRISLKLFKKPIFANMIFLSYLVALTNIISKQALLETVIQRVPQKAIEQNKTAIKTGFDIFDEKKVKIFNKIGKLNFL